MAANAGIVDAGNDQGRVAIIQFLVVGLILLNS
jgi:hypothetical protein